MDIQKQIEYWKNTGADDIVTAEVLLHNGRLLPCLFFCHLCIEKMIKAHVVRCTNEVPPKVHNLSYLLEKTDLILTEEQMLFCDTLMYYQLECRYPEYFPKVPTKAVSKSILKKTKEFQKWLQTKLLK